MKRVLDWLQREIKRGSRGAESKWMRPAGLPRQVYAGRAGSIYAGMKRVQQALRFLPSPRFLDAKCFHPHIKNPVHELPRQAFPICLQR